MTDKYIMDGHKLYWHLDRIVAWEQGERIAPLHIDVGLSKGCNLKCIYCFGELQGNVYRRGRDTYFPREPLLRYMREAGEAGVRSMAIIGEAEPLLNPHVYEAIVEGKRAGVDMSLGTNGVLYDTGRRGEEALEHLTWIRFNISAASEDAYRKVHRSREYSTTLEKIRFCVETKRRNGLDVTIGLQMVLVPENVDQVIPLALLGRDLGVDYLVIKQCSDTTDSSLGVYNRLGDYESFSDILRQAESLSSGDYNVIVKWNKVTNRGWRSYNRCLGTPFLLYSSGDGRLYPCGAFFDRHEEEYRMGDLVEQSFSEIIRSDRYREVVEKVKNIDTGQCYSNCKTHNINEFLWKIKHPPEHVNFV